MDLNEKLENPNVASTSTAPLANQADDDSDIDISKMNFEEIFFNPLTQKSVWNTLNSCALSKISESDDSQEEQRKSRKRKLKHDDPSEALPGASRPKVMLPLASKLGKKSSAENETGDKQPNPAIEKDFSIGNKMIEELMSRYNTAKKKHKMETSAKASVDPLDSSELEELSSESEDDLESAEDSRFLKFTIPQFEEKKLLRDKHYEAVEKLTPTRVEDILIRILPQLKKIKDNVLACRRNTIFMECGISKASLRQQNVSKPFTGAQEYRAICVIRKTFFNGADQLQNGGEIIHYINLVLLPEALIRIYARVNKVDYEWAEKEMMFGAKYDGLIPEGLLKTIK
ncbi:Ubiquitin thioesterase otulin [Orchesella cincta]|uniref:Ubiquitin thioesterase otulin n=1 Tax=Orchesella cincta TaxID=48709 RepID=A0A1D2MG06_ORCCI|nr:Ubiquitin thioesterase otulin [Orchesella cincta]